MANAGRYKQAVEIQEATETKGAMGGTDETWAKLTDLRAQVVHLSGRELVAAGQTQSAIKARAFIRYDPRITPKMRLVDDGVIYSIEAVIDRKSNRRDLELWLSQGLNDG